MLQPPPTNLDVNRPSESPPAAKPNGRFQFSLRAMCKLVVVVAVLVALPGLTELLPWPFPTAVKGVFIICTVLIWFTFFIVTVEYVFSYMIFRPQNWPSPWPWLEMAAIALLSLLPVISLVVRDHGERPLPNGYQFVPWDFGDEIWLADPQGRRVMPSPVIEWSVVDDMVSGTLSDGSFFTLDTATGENYIAENAEEIQQFLEGIEAKSSRVD